MPEATRGVLDTSIVIDHDRIDADQLPVESAITAVTLAALAAGPHAAESADERDRRARLADLLIAATAVDESAPHGRLSGNSLGDRWCL